MPALQSIEPTRTFPAKSLEFWFDYTCPFAYLGSTQASALAVRMNVTLDYRPLLLGGVFRAVGQEQNLAGALGAAKAAHNAMDMQRWARRFGVELRMSPNHPMRSVEALRATLATKIDPKVIDGFYRAYWVENRDIADRDVVADVVGRAGHDAQAVLAAINTQAIKDDLKKRTDEGIAHGMFGVPTWIVDGEHLYWGQDRMMFVEGRDPTDVKGPPRAPAATKQKTLEVFWDFSSPFAYLGCAQVEALAKRTNAALRWRPILLGGLFRSIGTPDVPLATFSQVKQRHIMKDIDRWAAYWGMPFKFPSRFPMNTVKALRTYLALPQDRRSAYQSAAFRAFWADDRDIGGDDVLVSCVGDEAIAKEALARASSDAVKGELRANTEEAAKRGVFGVPTFIVGGDDLYWGQDRLELVESALVSG